MNVDATPPRAPAKHVLIAILAIASGSAAIVLPGLNPNHPNQSTNIPSVAIPISCPGIALTLPSLEYFPSLGPSIIAPTNAAHPPMLWTTVEPAKSRNGVSMVASQPPPHIQ